MSPTETRRFSDPIFDPKWITPEGVDESIKLALTLEDKLKDQKKFGRLFKPYSSYLLGWSPTGYSLWQGLQTICLVDIFEDHVQQAEASRKILINYPVQTVIAAAVFQNETNGVRDILDLMLSATMGANLDMAWSETSDQSPDERILSLAKILSTDSVWQKLGTTEGRIEIFVDSVARLLTNPEMTEFAIDRIEKKPAESNYYVAISMALRKLLS